MPGNPQQPPGTQAAEDPLLHRYIPSELLNKLESARASGQMVGERRIVTMLFCDVKGSTAAAQQLDPEDWSEIINGAFEHMIRPVYKYEGTVARLMGDAILAFFGAPIAHEDDPERAVLAGLDIVATIASYRDQVQHKWGIDLNVRVGINTGLVVVGAVGSDLAMEYSALGDAINLAARMEQTAMPGTVQIAYDTYQLVSRLFEFEELGGIDIKGKSEQVLAYRVLGRQAAPTRTRGIRGQHSELVGRESELRSLRNVVLDLKQGVGRIVCVIGEAGLGKSRLLSETCTIFNQLIGSAGNWYEVPSPSYETNRAYGLIQRLIGSVGGIAYGDSVAVMREKLNSLVEILAPERRASAAQLFGGLLGLPAEDGELPLEDEVFRQELLRAIRDWWRAQFTAKPTILAFDDIHWSDAASIELFRQLLALTEEIPVVLLCALRIERQMAAWRIKTTSEDEYHHRYTEILLRPLSETESHELVSRLLAIAELPDRLYKTIFEKSGGNPYFIEEVVRAMIDSKAVMAEERVTQGGTQRYWRATSESAAFAIPDTLQSLLAARLDRLEDATRSVLQLASVIGRTFYYRLLQTVDDSGAEVDKHVDTLLKMEMIREAARVPEVEYVFRNPMTQEAVYQTILLKRRREFHRRVGEAMEALYPERLEAHFGLLAYHFALAGEHAKAIAYYRRASQQAIALFAYDDAIQNLQAALDLIKALAPTAMHLTLLEELADVYRMLRDGGRAIANFQMALDLQEGIADADQETRVRLHRKIVQVVTELKWTVSLEFLQQANASRLASRARLEESLGHLSDKPHPETVHVLVVLSTDAWRIQEPPDWDAAQQFAEAAVGMAEQLNDLVTLAQALGALANVLDGRSLLQAHLRIAERQLAICRAPHFDDVRELLEAIRRVGAAHVYIGAYAQALPYLIEAENLAVRAQIIDQQTNAIGLQSQCWFRLDRWDELLAGEEKWRALERRYPRERVGETCFYVGLCASAYAWRGESERAEIYRREAYEYMLSMSGSSQGWQRNQFYCRSLPLWAAGELTLVREHLETALKTSGQPIKRGTMPHDHDVYALLTDCAARQRDMAALQQYMPQAKELAERDGHKLYLAVVQRSAGVASCLVGSYDQAEMQFRTALESFEELGTRWQFARTLAELGELAQARSNFETARGYFSQSLAVFDEMQARPDAARIRAQLETLG